MFNTFYLLFSKTVILCYEHKNKVCAIYAWCRQSYMSTHPILNPFIPWGLQDKLCIKYFVLSQSDVKIGVSREKLMFIEKVKRGRFIVDDYYIFKLFLVSFFICLDVCLFICFLCWPPHSNFPASVSRVAGIVGTRQHT